MALLKGDDPWYVSHGIADLPSPALLVSPSRIEENIRRMIRMAGTAERLRPHVKTHKMSEIIRLKLRMGISRFKCSTLAEAEMAARCEAPDVMLAMQPVGPLIPLVFNLQKRFPGTTFSVISDHESILRQLSEMAIHEKGKIDVWLDINNGMNRTGIEPGPQAVSLYRLMSGLRGIRVRGLHVYDGHIHTPDPGERRNEVLRYYAPVEAMISTLTLENLAVPSLVVGGTPSFPTHAASGKAELSPGTLVLSDAGYQEHFPDLDFLPAAVIMTRVVSLPGDHLVCLDLGHKSIAAEMPFPRLRIPSLPDFTLVNHSEEHLVIRTEQAGRFHPGDVMYAVPWHICPTIPRYPFVYTVENHQISGTWTVDARDRVIQL